MIYSQLAGHDFLHFDDMDYLWANPVVRAGLSVVGVSEAFGFGGHAFAYWQPLTFLSLMLDMELFGLAPGPILLENALLHALAGYVLFLALRRATGQAWTSLLAAALFIAHPMNVESVAWAVERKTVLCGFFCMGTVYFHVRMAEAPGWKRQIPLAACFALGVMAKASLVTLPLFLLVMDYWPLRRLSWSPPEPVAIRERGFPVQAPLSLLLEKIPLFLLSIAATLMVFLSRQDISAVGERTIFPLSLRLANIPVSLVRYAGKFLFPGDMVVYYPVPESIPASEWGGALLLCLAALFGAWLVRRRFPYLLAGALLFLAMFIPVSGIIQTGLWPALADRFAYFPYVGFCVAMAWGGAGVGRVLVQSGGVSLRGKTVAAALPLAIVVYLASIAWAQVGVWRNGVVLFGHAAEVYPQNETIQINLAGAYITVGRLSSALKHFKNAVQLNPGNTASYQSIIGLLVQLDLLDQALELATKAKALFPRDRMYSLQATIIRHKMGLPVDLDLFRGYSDDKKLESTAQFWLGEVAMQEGKWAEAALAFDRLSSIKSFNPKILAKAGAALLRCGMEQEAEDRFNHALALYPALPEALRGKAAILRRRGEEATAQAMEARALDVDRSVSDAAFLLGEKLLESGHEEDAKVQYREALRIYPEHAGARKRLTTLP